MLVLCDTYDYEDYPVYYKTADEALARMKAPGDMQRVMKCYDLAADKDAQMKQSWTMALKA
jgi:hypothetical protein